MNFVDLRWTHNPLVVDRVVVAQRKAHSCARRHGHHARLKVRVVEADRDRLGSRGWSGADGEPRQQGTQYQELLHAGRYPARRPAGTPSSTKAAPILAARSSGALSDGDVGSS